MRRGCCLVCFEAFSSENLQWPPSDAELLYFCKHRRIELRSHDERDEIRARHCILIEHEPELEDGVVDDEWRVGVVDDEWRVGGPAQHHGELAGLRRRIARC